MDDDDLHHETHIALEILLKYIPTSDRETAIAEFKQYLQEWRNQRDQTLRPLS